MPVLSSEYSPSFSIPQYLSGMHGLELTDGVDPLQLISYVNFMEGATGVRFTEYSVTIPSFKTGNPSIDNIGINPDPYLLGLLNVKYLASEFPLVTKGLDPVGKYSDTYLYKNLIFMPRAWVQKEGINFDEMVEVETFSKADITSWSPNQIMITAEGPGILVLSEIDYPGWTVLVDEKKEDIKPAFELLRSVIIGDGKHEIVFNYRPKMIYLGVITGAIGWMYCLWMYIRKK